MRSDKAQGFFLTYHRLEGLLPGLHTMSAGKLTSLATSTLSLLLERQRLQASHPTLHLRQISTNLHKIREGIITASDDEVAEGLRLHYERLFDMLGEEEAEKAGLHPCVVPSVTVNMCLNSHQHTCSGAAVTSRARA